MVFKLKQPPQGPRRRMNARQISKEVGLSVDEVMSTLARLEEYVKSPASMLEEPVVRRLYENLDARYEADQQKAPPPWDRKARGDQTSTPLVASRDRHESSRSEWHSRPASDWWDRQSDVSPAWELESWKIFDFAEAERDAWIAHGLRPEQVKDAAKYRDAGLMPSDLAQDVQGWTALKRLRAGESPVEVLRLLGRPSRDERAI